MCANKQHQRTIISIEIPSGPLNFNNTYIYTSSNLASIKQSLNAAKSALDIYYSISKTNVKYQKRFLQFQNIIDLYKSMRTTIETKYNAKHVTNAWMKFWEIYNAYNIINEVRSQSRDTLYIFLNAELPGAALCAVNHLMRSIYKDIKYDWRASSLAPGNIAGNVSEALGDTYGLYDKNKNKWLMTLPDDASARKNNGDVTVIHNILDFEQQLGPDSEYMGMDIYNHDAGIDVSDDFNNQELTNAKIHFGCGVIGLKVLRRGGAFIAKQYTFFETFTWNLICIYASLFEHFYICKPQTSRPYNSEIYLIGINFKGLTKEIDDILMERMENFDLRPLLDESVMNSAAVSQIEHAARVIFGQQTNILKENIALWESYQYKLPALQNNIKSLKERKITEWLRTYPIKEIASIDQLPSFE